MALDRRSFFKSLAAFVAAAAVLPRELLKSAPDAEPILNWVPCDGRVLRRMDYPELFRVLENKFGGDDPIEGTFCVPNLGGSSFPYMSFTDFTTTTFEHKIKAEHGGMPAGTIMMFPNVVRPS